ncbi:type II toxin-antitoxin system VapC family toxin [Methanolobus vulcani]|uniref:type II toxin-antitoxin system VapC family toxin n=1 Tax=Methanolobus vulcani TaxID=38026 RepID=UPI0018ACE5C4|nr:type II toxin-antitoxin system VapC family toxin [Methanolobus vulcani]
MHLCIDSSVIVAALRRQEKDHLSALELLRKIKDQEHIAIEPYTVLVEVTAAIRRRTGSKELATRVKNDLIELGSFRFVDLDTFSSSSAAEIAADIGVRGMDAIVIQVAKEFGIPLITLDVEIVEKAKRIVEIPDLNSL